MDLTASSLDGASGSLERTGLEIDGTGSEPNSGARPGPVTARSLSHEIVAEIYGAALGRQPWTVSIARLRQPLWLKCGLVWIFEDNARTRADVESFGIAPEFRELLKELYDENDPFFAKQAAQETMTKIQASGARTGSISESAFVKRWVRPQGLEHGICASARARAPGGEMMQLVIMIWREAHIRAFSRAQVELVWSLLPHFRAGVRLQEARHRDPGDWRTTSRVLDRLPIGVIVLRRDGRPLKVNRWAADLIAACDGLFVSKDGLEATLRSESQILRAAIERAFFSNGSIMSPVETLTIRRTNGEPLRIFAYVLSGRVPGEIGDQSLAFVFVAENEMPTQEHGLLDDYGLTMAEARIALLIAAGHRLDRVAQQLGVSVSTARTHLQRIFNKTGTQRQVELVRLILMSSRSMME